MPDRKAKRVWVSFTPGDVVVFMIYRTRRSMGKLARRKPPDSWSRAARRILARIDRRGLRFADVSRALNRRHHA